MGYESEEGIDKQKFLRLIPKMYEDEKFKKILDEYLGDETASIVKAISDGQQLDEEILERLFEEAEYAFQESSLTAISLGWDGNAPGMSGAIWVDVVNGVYLFTSSDYEPLGPFESLDKVVELEYFYIPTPNPEISSELLSTEEINEILTGVLPEDID